MELSNKIEYALLAMLSLAIHYQDEDALQIRQIADEQNIPNRYLEQILAELRRSGLIRSERGARGGYRLAQDPQKITALAIVNCIEGADWQAENKSKAKTHESAAIFEIWGAARQAADSVLHGYTLQDLLEKKKFRQRSIMYYI